MPTPSLNPDQKAEVRSLRSSGSTMREIAGRFGVSVGTINRVLNPDPPRLHIASDAPPTRDVAARLADIPHDTRSLTARVFGDPLPGRSALDRSGKGA